MDRVLVIAPHPDDAELGMGGTIVKHKQQNDYVAVATLCTENFRNCPGEPTDQQQGVHSVNEAINAQKVLDYDDLLLCGLNDQTLDGPIINILDVLEPIYNKVKPSIVYVTHYGDNNQDHRAAFEATQVLCRPGGKYPPKKFLTYETPSSTEQAPKLQHTVFLPNYYITLTAEDLEKKIQAFECYKSEIRPLPNPRNADGLCNYAIVRGMECNADFAEAFQLIRYIDGE